MMTGKSARTRIQSVNQLRTFLKRTIERMNYTPRAAVILYIVRFL
jgi:hypothetical protein